MKQGILILLLVISTLILKGQDVKISSTIAASAGLNEENNQLTISKWSLGEIHLVILQHDESINIIQNTWEMKAYPNPCSDFLNVNISTEKKNTFKIQVTDILGQKVLFKSETTVIKSNTLKLDFNFLPSGTYLVSVLPDDQSVQRVMKIQKL